MKLSDLDYDYPEDLVATYKDRPSRVMWVDDEGEPQELTWSSFLSRFNPEDLIVFNNTKVIKARVFTESGLEILFIEALDRYRWKVLCPARRWKKGSKETLPDGITARLITSTLPQIIELDRNINTNYFSAHGEMPLPPYIQKVREERHQREEDESEYQSIFAKDLGSLAAPTASLHFQEKDIEQLKDRGVALTELTLHVGLGTFLPIHADSLEGHKMHSEYISIPQACIDEIKRTKEVGGRVWALGTTVARSLESYGAGLLKKVDDDYIGESDLFIHSDFKYKIVDGLLTNFHQPRSTLLALVGAFAGLETVKNAYSFAIERKFRLFSYGDLCAFEKTK